MTSEAKIAANRRNAQRSTGPRTASGKSRVRRNALKHGLAALVVRDPAVTAEVEQLAAAIGTDGARRSAPLIAECEVALKQVRAARLDIMAEMSLVPPTHERGVKADQLIPEVDRLQRCLDRLVQLERYERRALSKRKRAVRLAWPSEEDTQWL